MFKLRNNPSNSMAIKGTPCVLVLVLFTLCASTYAESPDVSDSKTGDGSKAVNCTITGDAQMSRAFLTCLFPFDISSLKIAFNVQAYHKTRKQEDAPELHVGCLWRNGLKCVGKENYVLLEDHEVKTTATIEIPIEEAKSHVYSCYLALDIHTSNPCSLSIQDKDNTEFVDNKTDVITVVVIIVSILAGVLVVVPIICCFLIKSSGLHAKGAESSQILAYTTADDTHSLSNDEQPDVKQWAEKQRNFLFECKNLADEASESVMDQFLKRTMEIDCEIKMWKEIIRKDIGDESALQLLNQMEKEVDDALKLLENMQEAMIRRSVNSKIRATNQGFPQASQAAEHFLSLANSLAKTLWDEGIKNHTAAANLQLIKSVKKVLCECLHRENSLKTRLAIEKSESALELETKIQALEAVRSTFFDLKMIFLDNLRLSVERSVLKRNREGKCTKMSEDEYLDCSLPNLTETNFIIPENPTHYEHSNMNFPGSKHQESYRINDLDIVHQKIHDCLLKIKENIATREVTVMLTQTSFCLYDKPFSALTSMEVAEIIQAQESVADAEQIFLQKEKYSDFIVISKLRGILGGIIQNVHISDPTLAEEKLRESVSYLENAAGIMKEAVKTLSEMNTITVHTTLILPNITRAQLRRCTMVQKAVQQIPCLCKDEMTSVDSLTKWWDSCWEDEHPGGLNSKVYKRLVAKFAIPALGVEKYLTALQQDDMQAGNTAGDRPTELIHEDAILSALPLNLVQLLDFDSFDDTQDDVKLLFGPPGTGKSTTLILRAMQWTSLNADRIFILQTSPDARAASILLQTQLQQRLRAKQQQPDVKERNTMCFFISVDISGQWKLKKEKDADEGGVVFTKDGKKMLFSSLRLSLSRQSENAIHILADEANGPVVVALYHWLKEKGVQKIRLWAATMETAPVPVPASLSHAVVQLTPGPALTADN